MATLNTEEFNSIRFITGLKFSEDMLRALSAMTFLYDSNWEASSQEDTTFPIAFFHTVGMHEVMNTETSKRPMLLYQSGSAMNKKDGQTGLLNVVSDNIIIQPKQYRMDVIIPYNSLSLFQEQAPLNSFQTQNVLYFAGAGKGDNITAVSLDNFTILSKIIKNLISALMRADYGTNGAKSIIAKMTSTPDFNKASLEAMWRNRSILKLKVWNSWRYKYVVITDFDCSKEPTEDGVYRASITCSEMPILTTRNYRTGEALRPYNNLLTEAIGKTVKDFVDGGEG